MKNNEELARLHVNEAIQFGLESQRAHRALSDSREEQSYLGNFAIMPSLGNLIKKFSQLIPLFKQIYQNAILTSTRD